MVVPRTRLEGAQCGACRHFAQGHPRPADSPHVAGRPDDAGPGGLAQTVQVADTAGHNLLNEDGTVNTDPTSRIPNSTFYLPATGDEATNPFVLLGGTGPYTQTVRSTNTGTYDDTILGDNFAVDVHGVAATPDANDTMTLDPTGSSFQFTTGVASKALTVQLLAGAADESVHTATINTESFQGGSDRLTFAAGQSLVYAHTGPATDYTLTLTGVDTEGNPTSFISPSLQIDPGDVETVTPSDWYNLNSGPVELTITHSDGRHEQLTLVDFGDVATATLANGVLTVNSGPSGHAIDLAESGTDISVTVDGLTRLFNASSVNSILVRGSDGNDRVTIRATPADVPVTVDGGGGDDTLTVDDSSESNPSGGTYLADPTHVYRAERRRSPTPPSRA